MSGQNVDIVRDARSAYMAGDFERSLRCFAEDWVGGDFPGLPDQATTYRGREGVRASERRLREIWRELAFEPVEFIDAGDDIVVAVVELSGHASGGDVPITAPAAFLYELRDAKSSTGLSMSGTGVIWTRLWPAPMRMLKSPRSGGRRRSRIAAMKACGGSGATSWGRSPTSAPR
jgi:ketosteroid isomerase-like protein